MHTRCFIIGKASVGRDEEITDNSQDVQIAVLGSLKEQTKISKVDFERKVLRIFSI